MSVSQRKDGRWLVKYKDPLSGAWKQRAFRDESEARRFDDETKYDEQKNVKLTLREAVVAYVRSHDLCEVGRWRYSFIINGYDRKDGKHTEGPAEFLADKFCTELDRRDLENLKMHLLERGNKGTTVNSHVGKLKSVLSWAESEDLIPFDPWRKYRVRVKDKVRHRDGTLEDFRKVYNTLPAWMQWACRTCLALCLRPGKELADLEWSAFDWDARCVTVYMPKVDRDKIVYPPDVYLEEAHERYLADTAASRHHVVHGKKTERVSYGSFRKVWAHQCFKVGVKMSPYAMRHIAASMMNAAGADMAAIAAQLGHSSVATTASFYTHVVASAQRQAAQVNPLVQLGAGFEAENKQS